MVQVMVTEPPIKMGTSDWIPVMWTPACIGAWGDKIGNKEMRNEKREMRMDIV